MAGDPIMTALLIGLGVDELSASPPLVPQIKYLVRRLKLAEARALAEFALNSESGAEILAKCQELAWQSAPSLFEFKLYPNLGCRFGSPFYLCDHPGQIFDRAEFS